MAGNVRITADGVILTSGKPQRVYGLSFYSDGTGDASVILYNGTDATGTEYDRASSPSETVGRLNYGQQGRFFPGGCFIDMNNCSYVDVEVEQVQS